MNCDVVLTLAQEDGRSRQLFDKNIIQTSNEPKNIESEEDNENDE
jgi:hypothetical protein